MLIETNPKIKDKKADLSEEEKKKVFMGWILIDNMNCLILIEYTVKFKGGSSPPEPTVAPPLYARKGEEKTKPAQDVWLLTPSE